MKFNEALAYNKELRRQIDNLRRERFMFDKIYKKLEEELREKKNQMATIIELSNQAYEARDGAQLEIAAIQQSMAKDRGEFEEKMDQFNAIIQERNRCVVGARGGGAGACTRRGGWALGPVARCQRRWRTHARVVDAAGRLPLCGSPTD